MTSVDYVNASIKTVEERIKGTIWWMILPARAITLMDSQFQPELDTSEELDADDTKMYQKMIGMLRWATEIGRVDMLLELSLLSQYQANPRRGHMEQLLHIFGYLKRHPKITLYFNP